MLRKYPSIPISLRIFYQKWIVNFIKNEKRQLQRWSVFSPLIKHLMNWIKRFISIELSFHSWSKLYYIYNVLLDSISLYITLHQHSYMRLVWSFLFWVLFCFGLFFTVKVCYQSDTGAIKAINKCTSLSPLKQFK